MQYVRTSVAWASEHNSVGYVTIPDRYSAVAPNAMPAHAWRCFHPPGNYYNVDVRNLFL